MAKIFPIDYEEKNSIAPGDFVLFSDAEDWDKIKKAQYSNLKWEKGDPGSAATVTVGSTTTGTPWSSASVVNSGTTSAAVLDFTIPEGEKGEKGDTWAAIVSAEFDGYDMVFTESDGTTVTLTNAKVDLKGDKGDTWNPGAAATIAVGTVTTLDPEDSATVTNSGTSSAAVFNFGIPKWDKGDKGDTGNTWSAATVTVGSTTTWAAGTNASVVNAGTSSAAVLNFTIPKGDKGDQGSEGATWPAGNGIASITSSKAWKTTTVTITETNTNSYSFNVEDWADWQGAGDVTWPASSTNWSLVLFDGNTGKIIKEWGSIVNNLTTDSATDVLSAAQGKALKDAIDNISGLGKFLSLWDSTTWLPISFPLSTPYTYTTWDRYMVETVGATNYKPNGSSYTWSASSTVESWAVEVGDVYIYDGTTWLLQQNTEPEVSFSAIAWSPSDNTALANALNAKANDNAVVKLTWNQTVAGTKTFSTSPVVPSKTAAATNTGTAIATEAQVYTVASSLSTLNTNAVKTSWNQSIGGTKTFTAEPVLPSKSTAAGNNATKPATEAQVYNVAQSIPTVPTNVSAFNNDSGYLTSSTWVTSFNGSSWAITYTAPVTSVNGNTWAVTVDESVVSGDSGTTYTIKVSNSEPWSSTPATTITFVTA